MFNFLSGVATKDNTTLKEALAAGAMLVDVRSEEEFEYDRVEGAVNIPLEKLSEQLQKFEGKSSVVVFCISGMRSSQAKHIIESCGVAQVINGVSSANVRSAIKK